MNQPWLTTIDWPVRALEAKAGEEHGCLGHVLDGRELAVDRLLQHDGPDDLLLGNAELARLLGDLLVDERRAHEAGADHVGADAMRGALLGDHLGKTDQAVLGRHIGRLEQRGLLGVDRAHVDDAAAVPRAYMWRKRGPRRQEGAVEMDRPAAFATCANSNSIDRRHDLDPGIADQDVDAAPKASTVLAMPASTCASSLTSIATPMARFRSAQILARDRSARVLVEVGDDHLGAFAGEDELAISLPMPLAAPVTTATLFSRRMASLSISFALAPRPVESRDSRARPCRDPASGRRRCGAPRQTSSTGSSATRRQGVGVQLERRRARPGSLHRRCPRGWYSTSSQMRGVPSTCGMILRRKFGSPSAARTAPWSAGACL